MKNGLNKLLGWFEKHAKTSYTLTVSIAIFIFYISSISFTPLKDQTLNNIRAIIYHVGIFFLFSFFLLISSIKRKKLRLIPLTILISFFYAILDETHQLYTPGRFFTFEDLMWDASGILIASMIYLIFCINKNLKSTKVLI